ncbi:MAG: DNA mismatch repair protein MutS [Firmicutes bacterium]|nr:DNA mismatch repair protein MutS [Bacillota bacterium]
MTIVTPMLRQYQELKEQYRDCLLFFRLGDFYEMFYEDAVTASSELSIVLTARDSGGGQRAPMCGVPHHAVDVYVHRLIAKGYKVAICEQLEDAKAAKGIVKRDVIRVITPGTVLENNMLVEKSHNYLAALAFAYDKNSRLMFGLAYVDISSGDFWVTEIGESDVWNKLADELARIQPAELLLPDEMFEEEFFRKQLSERIVGSISHVYDDKFVQNNAAELLVIHFAVVSPEALGLKDHILAQLAAAYILDFLRSTQKRSLSYIDDIRFYATEEYLYLDAVTRRNLELTSTLRGGKRQGSLLAVLDKTLSAMGGRQLAQWLEKPLLNTEYIQERLDAVEEFIVESAIADDIRALLKDMYDLPRLISRICYGSAGPREISALQHTLRLLPEFFAALSRLQKPLFRAFLDELELLEDVTNRIADVLKEEDLPVSPKDGNFILPGFNVEVDELRDILAHGKERLLKLEAQEKERTGIRTLKVGYNKVFGYFIEVSKSYINQVPENYIRKQTIANGERYITEALKEEEARILGAGERLLALEYQLFTELREYTAAAAARIQRTAEVLAHVDALQSLALIARENDYCKPVVNDSSRIEIHEGRHPVVELSLGRENYVPNDTMLDCETRQMMLITGPNMAGKSTYMRQVALIVLLARCGSYVPATFASIGKIDRIFTRVGLSDDLTAGQSTFMVEMMETSNILRHATSASLIILDEIGRGTSTFDGLSIAWAVAEHIMRPQLAAKTLFATHYHELTALTENFPLIKNYCIAVREKEGKVKFLRRIMPGAADKSYGIQVAALAGLPQILLMRAREILRELEAEKHLQAKMERGEQITFADILAPAHNPQEERILKELSELESSQITPLQALAKIDEWQKILLE